MTQSSAQLRIKVDSEGYFGLLFKAGSAVMIQVYSPQYELISELKVPYSTILFNTLSGFRSTKENMTFYFSTMGREKDAVDAYVLSKKKGGQSGKITGIILTDIKKHRIISSFNREDECYIVLYMEELNQFHIVKMGEMRSFETSIIEAEEETKARLLKGNDKYVSIIDFLLQPAKLDPSVDSKYRFIDPTYLQSLSKTYPTRKLFLDKDKVHLIRDKEGKDTLETVVISLDLLKKEYSLRTLFFKPTKGSDHNSTYSENKLYSIETSSKLLNFRVFDFYDFKILANFKYTIDDKLDLMWSKFNKHDYRTPSQVEIEQYGYKIKEFTKTSVILKHLSKGHPIISVNPIANNRILVSIGSYDPVELINSPFPNFDSETDDGVASITEFKWYDTGTAELDEGVMIQDHFDYFNSVMDKETLQVVDNDGSMTIFDKSKNYLAEKQKGNYQYVNYLNYSGEKYFIFYSRKRKVIEVINLSN